MGAQCAQTSCGQSFIKWKALKEMNSKGVYTPEQVTENTEYYWNRYAESGASTVDKATASKIVKATVNYLGGIGSGARFTDEAFDSKYKVADPLGMEKNL